MRAVSTRLVCSHICLGYRCSNSTVQALDLTKNGLSPLPNAVGSAGLTRMAQVRWALHHPLTSTAHHDMFRSSFSAHRSIGRCFSCPFWAALSTSQPSPPCASSETMDSLIEAENGFCDATSFCACSCILLMSNSRFFQMVPVE